MTTNNKTMYEMVKAMHDKYVGVDPNEGTPCKECEELIGNDGDGHNSRCGSFRQPPPDLEIETPLRLEAGKYYKNRRGEVVGPLKANDDEWKKTHPFACGGLVSWTPEGRYLSLEDDSDEDDEDLISEHIAPQSEEDRAKAALEARAKEIYESWTDDPEYRPWVPFGNSDKQYEARKLAWQEIESATPDFPAVGTRLIFIKDGNPVSRAKRGDKVTVTRHYVGGFKTTTTTDHPEWSFGFEWKKFLEPLPTPPVRPEGEDSKYRVLLLASYCGPGEACNEDHPCDECLRMSNVFDVDNKAIQSAPCIGQFDQLREDFLNPEVHESQLVAGEKPFESTIETFAKASAQVAKVLSGKEPGATYPPPESEWPEKLPAPEGCVWERMTMSGIYELDQTYICLFDSPLRWEAIKGGGSWIDVVTFRAVPAPQWRELGPKEIPLHGVDEGLIDGEWQIVPGNTSTTNVEQWMFGSRFKAFRTRRPLPPSDYVDPVSGVTVPDHVYVRFQDGKGTDIAFPDGGGTTQAELIAKGYTRFDQASPEERKAREWDAVIATEGNQTFPEGYLIGQHRESDRPPDTKDAWRIGRVREILDGNGGGE